MKNITVVNALCGAGKTFSYCNSILESTHKYHIISVPSKELQNEIAEKYFAGNIQFKIINSDYNPHMVTKSLIDFCSSTQTEKHVVIITHATLHGMNDISCLKDYQLHLDEVPDHLIQRWTVKYDWNHSHNAYFTTDSNNITSLTADVLNDTNKNSTLEKSTLGQLIAAHQSDRTIFQHTTSKKFDNGDTTEEYLQVFTPNWFPDNTTIYTADGQILIPIKIMKDYYSKDINLNIVNLDTARQNNYDSNKIIYKYFLKNRNNSKNIIVNEKESYYAGINTCFQDTNNEPTLMLKNSFINDLVIPENVTLLPHNLHGINKYDSWTKIILQSSRNRTPTEEACLKEVYGLTIDDVLDDRLATLHQAIMRTALRKADFDGDIVVYGVDARTGNALKKYFFSNMKIELIGDITFGKGVRGTSKVKDKLTKEENNRINYLKAKAKAKKFAPMICAKILLFAKNKEPRKILEMGERL